MRCRTALNRENPDTRTGPANRAGGVARSLRTQQRAYDPTHPAHPVPRATHRG